MTERSGRPPILAVLLTTSHSRFDGPLVLLTRQAPHHGIVANVPDGLGIDRFADPVHGHAGHYMLKVPTEPIAGYWLGTTGKYYLQVSQDAAHGKKLYSPIYVRYVRWPALVARPDAILR